MSSVSKHSVVLRLVPCELLERAGLTSHDFLYKGDKDEAWLLQCARARYRLSENAPVFFKSVGDINVEPEDVIAALRHSLVGQVDELFAAPDAKPGLVTVQVDADQWFSPPGVTASVSKGFKTPTGPSGSSYRKVLVQPTRSIEFERVCNKYLLNQHTRARAHRHTHIQVAIDMYGM